MTKKASAILRALRTVDDVCKLTTGKRLNAVIASAVDLFGQDALNKSAAEQDPAEIARKLPYIILGINPDCPDFIVRAAYKQYMKEFHTDINKTDGEKAKQINNAYETICKERGIPK
jgi:hypothetical protein